MRIAYFSDTFAPEVNGVANTLSHLRDYLSGNGIDSLFFVPRYGNEPDEKDIIRYRGLPFLFSPNSRLSLPLYEDVLKKLKAFHPDLVHITTEFTIGSTGLRAVKQLGIPAVTSFHTNIEQYLEYYNFQILDLPAKAFFRQFHSQALRTYVPSSQTMNQLKEQGYRNLEIWSRGVDTQLYSPQRRTGVWKNKLCIRNFMCLYAGRLSSEKSLDTYLNAIRIINANVRNQFTFVFAGDGPYRKQLEESGINNIILTGFVRGTDLAQLYADADLFVFPSGTETFGNVLLEAMASGDACIATDSGGVTDFAIDGNNACVIPYRDSVKLAEAILDLKEDSAYRAHLSANARQTALMRSWDAINGKLVQSYREILTTCKAHRTPHNSLSFSDFMQM